LICFQSRSVSRLWLSGLRTAVNEGRIRPVCKAGKFKEQKSDQVREKEEHFLAPLIFGFLLGVYGLSFFTKRLYKLIEGEQKS
jgi:hypothetical protein